MPKVYVHAHDYYIHSISNNRDGETFLSADDLRINLWNLDINDQCFNIIDMKPLNMDDLTVDMKQSALCDNNAKILQDGDSHALKSFLTEIIASISDMKFT